MSIQLYRVTAKTRAIKKPSYYVVAESRAEAWAVQRPSSWKSGDWEITNVERMVGYVLISDNVHNNWACDHPKKEKEAVLSNRVENKPSAFMKALINFKGVSVKLRKR